MSNNMSKGKLAYVPASRISGNSRFCFRAPAIIMEQPLRRICIKCQVSHLSFQSEERVCTSCKEQKQCA